MANLFSDVAVIGGGIQGCCIALELARRGHVVNLLEQDRELMNRASLRNEGKIHLGLIYANEPELITARLQLHGALSFAALIQRWTGQPPVALGLSTPFHYLVANESILSPDELQLHYEELNAVYDELCSSGPTLSYLGSRPHPLFSELKPAQLAAYQVNGDISAGFDTAERAINPDCLKQCIATAVSNHPRIRVWPACKVERVSRHGCEFLIEYADSSAKHKTLAATQVANASWDGRLAIDRTLGLEVGTGWLYRRKYRVIVTLPEAMKSAPSATMVIGRFGDVVIRPDDTAYLSWYPSAVHGWSHELSPPAGWEASCTGQTEPGIAMQLAREFRRGVSSWYPGLEQQRALQVDAGVIFAHGTSDVNDPASGLHSRAAFGVTSRAGYHSVNAGKLTTAPLVAIAAADRICGQPANDLGDLALLLGLGCYE